MPQGIAFSLAVGYCRRIKSTIGVTAPSPFFWLQYIREAHESSAELGDALIYSLKTLDVHGFKRFFRNVATARVKMVLSIELREKSDDERAIHWLLGAIAIADILESEELDRRLGELLKVYQAAWARLPSAAGPVPPRHPWRDNFLYRHPGTGRNPGAPHWIPACAGMTSY